MDTVKRLLLTVIKPEAEVESEQEPEESINSSQKDEVLEAQFDLKLEQRLQENKSEKPEKNIDQELPDKYVVEIPNGTKLEQIHALKDFLTQQADGSVRIYILLG
jgi:hypothetical protein